MYILKKRIWKDLGGVEGEEMICIVREKLEKKEK